MQPVLASNLPFSPFFLLLSSPRSPRITSASLHSSLQHSVALGEQSHSEAEAPGRPSPLLTMRSGWLSTGCWGVQVYPGQSAPGTSEGDQRSPLGPYLPICQMETENFSLARVVRRSMRIHGKIQVTNRKMAVFPPVCSHGYNRNHL